MYSNPKIPALTIIAMPADIEETFSHAKNRSTRFNGCQFLSTIDEMANYQ